MSEQPTQTRALVHMWANGHVFRPSRHGKYRSSASYNHCLALVIRTAKHEHGSFGFRNAPNADQILILTRGSLGLLADVFKYGDTPKIHGVFEPGRQRALRKKGEEPGIVSMTRDEQGAIYKAFLSDFVHPGSSKLIKRHKDWSEFKKLLDACEDILSQAEQIENGYSESLAS